MPYVGQASFLHSIRSNLVNYFFCVNALCRASLISTSFTMMLEFLQAQTVSMPYVGQASFLPETAEASVIECQCPMSGKPHFYFPFYHILIKFTLWVSMPYVGQASFLLSSSKRTKMPGNTRCQCPMSGKPHFYPARRSTRRPARRSVSMPYVGQASFLRNFTGKRYLYRCSVSMPYVGQASFLLKLSIACRLTANVSMPYVGQASFLHNGLDQNRKRR